MQDAMSRRDSGSDGPQNGNIKDLIKGYVDNNLSRRQFLAGLAGLGLSASAASSLAKDLNPFVTRTDDADPEPLPGWARSVHGTGGQLIIEQLKAAGVEHLFINASSGQGPVLDALVDEPNMHIIKAVEEGNLVGMADGYARASGKTPFVMFARPGLPNGMTMMFNAWKDYIPMVVLTDDVPMAMLGQDGFEAMDHMASMTQTMTKWHWNSGAISKIPEDLRRAFKFASTRPSGPVFLSVPNDLIAERSEAIIMDQTKFQVPMQIAPDPAAIRQIAKILLEAENPMILAGDEIGYCDAQKEVVELAELLGATVTKTLATTWSKPFPCVHPLYVETYVPTSRFPGKLDVLLNLGSRMPLAFGDKLQIESNVKLIQIRLDSENLARVYPTDQAVIADIKLATAALIEEVNRQAPSQSRLKRIAGERLQRVRSHKGQRREVLTEIAKRRWNDAPLSGERLINELEKLLDKDSIVVSENDTYRYHIDHYFRFGPEDKGFFANAGFALGWGLPAAFGVKLALPDKPVVSIVSDGGFLFSGPQPIWSYARHKAPIIVIVMNNRSYNDERNRILQLRGRSYETGLDMSCYLGDPDVNYARLASGFGVEGEVIEDADSIKAAVQRAQSATKEGRAYLLDVHVARTGSLANSTWHPEYHISSLRSRQV
jgi:benzoylformate decarboxylase